MFELLLCFAAAGVTGGGGGGGGGGGARIDTDLTGACTSIESFSSIQRQLVKILLHQDTNTKQDKPRSAILYA